MENFDVLVIGSGSGLEVSMRASELGLSVAVVEEGPFGGTCHNRGCIPSKMLIHSADVMETIKGAGAFGIKAVVESVDWPGMVRRVFDDIDREAAEIEEGNRQDPNISVFKARARFVGPKTLEVDGQRISAETVVIAAGTRPFIPEIAGLSNVPYVASDDAMRLQEQPKSLTIVGGGYIAAEMAHFFGSMGTEVTLIYRGPVLLRGQDSAIAQRFTEVFQRRFNILLNTQVLSAEHRDGGITLEVSTAGETAAVSSEALPSRHRENT